MPGLGRRHEPDAVLVGASRHPHVRLIHGEEVGHVHDDFGALQGQRSGDLRNAAVEADQQTDAPQLGIHDRAAVLSRSEPVLIVCRAELLVIMDHQFAACIEQKPAVVDLAVIRIELGEAAGDMHLVLPAQRGHRRDIAARHRFGDFAAVRLGIEEIARIHAFGKHDQLRPLTNGLFGVALDQCDVRLDVAEVCQGLDDRRAKLSIAAHCLAPHLKSASVRILVRTSMRSASTPSLWKTSTKA